MTRLAFIFLGAIAAALVSGCSREANPQEETPVIARTAPEMVGEKASIGGAGEDVTADFKKRVDDYVALRTRVAGTIKQLSDKATPEQIDANQRALAALVAKERAGAKPGDIFTPKMQEFVRGLLKRVFNAPDGSKVKASLMDENPMGVKLSINGRYPDAVPLSTMPTDVLSALPQLPEDLEYRVVGNRLVLFDTRSHLIVDLVENAFER